MAKLTVTRRVVKRVCFQMTAIRKQDEKEETIWRELENLYSILAVHSRDAGFFEINKKIYTGGYLEICFLSEREEEVKKVIKDCTEKKGFKIEFEEEKKEEKWIPVHEIFLKNPTSLSRDHVPTFPFLYAEKAKAPKEAIPELLKHFEAVLLHSGGYLHEILEKAIKNLKQQQKET